MPPPTICFERHPGAAAAPLPPAYRPRRPEKTVLDRVVSDHLETTLAQARVSVGAHVEGVAVGVVEGSGAFPVSVSRGV